MASYTDKIPTFNPYVAQQPVDAMLKVGMYKQQKYEEGVQKIQTSIDNVAGLDIANAAQQKYLQSKLNALGNNLKFVAAGDFSDFSLVNSVNGMTKQIVKDDNVINAVSSTAKLRAGYKKRDELAKKGLTDKNNDDYYDMYANEYINSEDVKASFNAEYIPYTNITKKLQEALVNSGETTTTAEQIFVTDPNTGKPITDENGKLVYADSMAVQKIKTNKPAVIAAINGVMNQGDVKQQLAIDGWATYRNTEATELLEPLKTQYDDERTKLEGQSLEITAMMISTNLSPEEKEKYEAVNSEIQAAILRNDQSFMSLSKLAEEDPESFKQNYYTKETKERLLNQFLKKDISDTNETNPALQQQNWRDTMAFNQKVENNKIAYQNATLAISQSDNQRKWLEFYGTFEQDPVTGDWNKKLTPTEIAEAAKKKANTVDANKPIFPGGTSGNKVSAIDLVNADTNFLSESKGKLAFSMYADIIRLNNDNAKLSDEAILNSVQKFAKQAGITPETYLDRWAVNITNKYVELGLTPPANLLEQVDEYRTLAKNLNNKKAMTDIARKEADKEAGVDEDFNNVLKNKRTLNFNVNGKKITITPREMLGLISTDVERLFKMFNKEGQQQLLKRKDLTNGQRQLIANWDRLPREMRDTVMQEFSSYTHGGDLSKYQKTLEKANELFNSKLSKVVGVTDSITQSLSNDTDETKAAVGNITAYVTGGPRNYGPNTDKAKILKALKNDPTISWVGKKPTTTGEQWTGKIIVSDKDGNDYTITNVNHADLESMTGKTLVNYVEKPIDDLININTNTKSTNSKYMVNSPNAWKTSYFRENEANPEITTSGWGYRADVVKAVGGGYRIVNYIKAPKTNYYVTIYGGVAKDEYTIDRTYKNTTSKQLESLYMTQLQYQNK
jgi:hypothetical protein